MERNETPRDPAYKAVSNYLANELGIDRNYVQSMLEQKIDARNPGKLIEDAVAKYFRKGPDGWRADKTVRVIIENTVREHIQETLRSGGAAYLNGLLREHLEQICGRGPDAACPGKAQAAGSLPYATGYSAAVLMRWTAADNAMVEWTRRTFGADSPVRAVVEHYPARNTGYAVTLERMETLSHKAAEPLAEMLTKTEKSFLDCAMTPQINGTFHLPKHVVLRALSESDELRYFGVSAGDYICMEDGLLCLPPPMPIGTDPGAWPGRKD